MAGFALILIALAVLCASVMAQEDTADYWYKKGTEVMGRTPWEDVLKMYDKAIELSPNNATYWAAKGSAFSFLALGTNNLSYYNESLEAYNKAVQIDPENPWTWDQIGSTLLQLKRYNESLEARDRAIESINSYQGYLPVSNTEMLSSIWAGKAFTLQEAGRMDESIAAFDKSLQINPGNYEAYMMKGRALKAMGKYNESTHACSIGSNQPPVVFKQENGSNAIQENTADYWFDKGYELFNQESFKEAVDAFNRSIEIDPQHFDSWLYKGAALKMLAFKFYGQNRIGVFEESLKAYDRALEINPNNASAWTFKGDALDNMAWSTDDPSRFNQSLQAFDKALELDPKDAGTWHAKGVTLIHFAQYKEGRAGSRTEDVEDTLNEALSDINKAIEINPETPGALENKASLLETFGKHDEALESANSTQDLAKVWYNRAVVLRNEGKFNEALDAYDKAIELDPQDAEARIDKGMTFLVMGKFNESLAAFDEALVIEPNSSTLWREEGLVLSRMGRFNDSLKAYEEAIKIDPINPSALAGRGFTLSRMDRYGEALQAFDNKVIEIDPAYLDIAGVWFAKGEALDKLGRHDEAAAAYESALSAYDRELERNPDVAKFWASKGETLKALGRKAEADAAFAKAKELGYQG